MLGADVRADFIRGMGISCGKLLRRGIAEEAALVGRCLLAIPKGEREIFAAGAGLGLAEGAGSEDLPAAAFEVFPPDYHAVLRDGARAVFHADGR